MTDGSPETRSGGRAGCWIAGVATLACAATFIFVGLFAPPVRLLDRLTQPAWTPVAPGTSLTTDGLTVTPLDGIGASLQVSAQAAAGEAPAPSHQYTDRVYALSASDETTGPFRLQVSVPAGYDAAQLDLYGWNADQSGLRFIPSTFANGALIATIDAMPAQLAVLAAAPVTAPNVLVSVDVTQALREDVANAASIIAPAGLQPAADGSLVGSLAAGFDLSQPYQVMPVIRNFSDARATDPETVAALLRSPELRTAHARQLARFASSGFDGLMLDYRDLPPDMRDAYSALVQETAAALDAAGLSLGVVLPAPDFNADGTPADTGAYDWAALGEAADVVQILVPADRLLPATAGASVTGPLLNWAARIVPRDHLLLTLYAVSQRQTGDAIAPIGYEQALSALGDVTIETASAASNEILQPGEAFRARLDGYRAVQGTDVGSGLPFIDFTDDQGAAISRVWLMTPAALVGQATALSQGGFGGIALNDLNAAGLVPGVTDALASYRLGLPLAGGDEALALRWSIQNADGVEQAVVIGLNEPLIATIAAPEGNYAVNAAIVSGSDVRAQRAGAAVAVFLPSPTYTPSPTPTLTPTPPPTATAAPAPVVVVSADQMAAAGAPVVGSIVAGTFEYGGHVASTQTNYAESMRRAGMNWMKVQLRYGPGMSPEVASTLINEAHGRGFKILLGIVGSPGDLAAGGAGYMQQFASFVGGVAGYGPDAIEVWNEPNLDREWPEGQISGAYYADLLRQSYTAIKSANSGVMVISGAPAPTGAEAAYPGRVMNDDNWVRELVAAGGLQYMDCLGAHYNEGIVGPSQTSGDPRDNYYTRYFQGMLNAYTSLTGGQRPICFTELGYLTPEGFGPLPSYFAWAQNVTLAQQAAWLAEAAAIASQSGQVRLMIVWNIDFTGYDSDPQAGYAIVRPGGGCPACDALAAAR